MNWNYKNKRDSNKVIISLSDNNVRFFLLEQKSDQLAIIQSDNAEYQSLDQLDELYQNWVEKSKSKNIDCHWLISRKLYKAITIKKPNIPDSEVDKTIQWLIKDQIEQPLSEIIASYYEPNINNNDNLIAIVVDRLLVEKLINLTHDSSLNLLSIGIDEITIGGSITDYLVPQKTIGLIDQDQQGLTFNFYYDGLLSFTRHIKGSFFPKGIEQEFSLEDKEASNDYDNQSNRFILETQRTLDYCVSQVFRHPVDSLIINENFIQQPKLIHELESITELPVVLHQSSAISKVNNDSPPKNNSSNDQPLTMTLAEIGLVLSYDKSNQQKINLYLPKYRPQPLEFGAKFASSIIALFIVSFLTLGFYQTQEINHLETSLQQETTKLQKLQATIQEINRNKNNQEQLLNIDQRIINRQAVLQNSRLLLLKVKKMSLTKSVYYSDVLLALSQQQEPTLWLTNINLTPSHISLQGQTTIAKKIPSYIEKLANNKVLSSQFLDFSIERDQEDQRIVNFNMNNGRYNHVQ